MRGYPHDVKPVEDVSSDDTSRMKQCVSWHIPFLAKGLVNGWPLVRKVGHADNTKEQIAVFEKLIGDSEIRFSYTPATQHGDIGIGPDLNANFKIDQQVAQGTQFLKMLDKLVHKPTGECIYAAALPVSSLPALDSELSSVDSVAGMRRRQKNLWIGSGDHVVDLHFDTMRNLLSMVAGVKRVTIFPPEALPYIYPAPLHRPVAGVTRSLVKLLDADLLKYPRFEAALSMAQVAVVQSGDTLHIPPLWWHHVESYGFNAMVNAWYDDISEPSIASYERANVLFRKSVFRFSRIDDEQLAAVAKYMDATVFSAKGNEDVPLEKPMLLLRRRLDRIHDSLCSVPDFWRKYLQLQYEYYCLRKYGDPYPTLPGMLQEVASALKLNIWRGIRRRASKLFS